MGQSLILYTTFSSERSHHDPSRWLCRHGGLRCDSQHLQLATSVSTNDQNRSPEPTRCSLLLAKMTNCNLRFAKRQRYSLTPDQLAAERRAPRDWSCSAMLYTPGIAKGKLRFDFKKNQNISYFPPRKHPITTNTLAHRPEAFGSTVFYPSCPISLRGKSKQDLLQPARPR